MVRVQKSPPILPRTPQAAESIAKRAGHAAWTLLLLAAEDSNKIISCKE